MATNKEIYNRGAFGSGYSQSSVGKFSTSGNDLEFRQTAIYCPANNYGIRLMNAVNLTPYSTINVAFSTPNHNVSADYYLMVYGQSVNEYPNSAPVLRQTKQSFNAYTEQTISVDISSLNQNGWIVFFEFTTTINLKYVHRIYFT